ncbi:MAG: hydrogenase iron-sulfur subunit [Deltaproteobacteria bacterium]|nr:hydrogenase iron-sulfur subunit [Deltaproteobacteria bacterium]
MLLTQELLDIAGIGKDRLHFAWVSSAEAKRFVEIATSVIDSVKSQGKLDALAFEMELSAAEMTLEGETLRWLVGKEVTITTKGDVYGRKWDVETYESVLLDMLEREYHKNLIYLAIKQACTNVRDISAKTGLDLLRISYLLADMERTSMVEFAGMENSKPVFAAL